MSDEEKALQIAALRNATSMVAARRRVEDERDRARADAEAARAEVEALNKVGTALASELDVERIAQTVTDAATNLTGAEFGAFFYNVVDKQGEKLTLCTLSGSTREASENFGQPRPTPVVAPTFYGTSIVRSDDITKEARDGDTGPYHGHPLGHLPVHSYLAVPVASRTGDVIGDSSLDTPKSGFSTSAPSASHRELPAGRRSRWTTPASTRPSGERAPRRKWRTRQNRSSSRQCHTS
jgi:hypothetical protein